MSRSPRKAPARPIGKPPRGFALGYMGISFLSAGAPLVVMTSLVPVIPNGVDVWIASFAWIIGAALLMIVIMVAGFYRLPLWGICYLFGLGCALLAVYAVGVVLTAAVLLHALPLHDRQLYFFGYVAIAADLIMAIPAYGLFRLVRMRYWQPWTTADQWEPLDDRPNRYWPEPKTTPPP